MRVISAAKARCANGASGPARAVVAELRGRSARSSHSAHGCQAAVPVDVVGPSQCRLPSLFCSREMRSTRGTASFPFTDAATAVDGRVGEVRGQLPGSAPPLPCARIATESPWIRPRYCCGIRQWTDHAAVAVVFREDLAVGGQIGQQAAVVDAQFDVHVRESRGSGRRSPRAERFASPKPVRALMGTASG